MPQIKNGFVFATLVFVGVAAAQGQVNEPPPIDSNQHLEMGRLAPGMKSIPLSLPLIDDVIHQALYQPNYGNRKSQPAARKCQLNAPLSSGPEEEGDNCEQSGFEIAMVASGGVLSTSASGKKLWMMPAPQLNVVCECHYCDGSGFGGFQSSCPTCTNGKAPFRPSQMATRRNSQPIEDYCDDVSKALIVTLNGSRNNPLAQQRAIQAALKMVVEQAHNSHAAIAESNSSDSQEPQDVLPEPPEVWRQYLASQNQTSAGVAAVQGAFPANLSVLEPVYATQFRNSAQLKKLTENNQRIMSSLLNLEKKFASFSMMQQAKLNGSDVRRMMNSIEEEEARERELATLQTQLKVLDNRIQELLSNPLRQANHLEPIYAPNRTLRPIRPSYQR